jgi:SHS2 domain-containing protein
MPKPCYELLPHMTDAYVQATGTTLERALESAGLALFDIMCEVDSISPKLTDNVELNGADEVALLYNWLEALLLKFELDGRVYSRFKVNPLKKTKDGLAGTAKLSGEPYDRRKHGSKVEVKAVTLHKMEAVRGKSSTTVRFILDL